MKLLKIGLTGTLITAICCFTPALVMLFSALGISALIGYLDYVLLPALGVFIAISVYAVWCRKV
ncbi:MAG: mercury resistance system transport protein MerF [Halopseudomonas sp.]